MKLNNNTIKKDIIETELVFPIVEESVLNNRFR